MLNSAIINLSNIVSNAETVKKRLPKTTKLCAVVKADAYGHGAEVVSNAIHSIADYFAVALAEEGVALRYSGVFKPILVLGRPQKTDYILARDFDLTLTACEYADVVTASRMCQWLNARVNMHIKYNTGMNRLGLDGLAELERTLEYAKKSPFVRVTGIYSHYARPQLEKERVLATKRFILAEGLAKSYDKDILAHISASGGFLQGEYFDMVRIGILLYGYKPFERDNITVKPAMQVYAPVIKNRTIKKGEGGLYGQEKTFLDTPVSLIRYGYADGLGRENTFGQYSSRCMDITAIFGNKKRYYPVLQNARALANKYNTIPYEILCRAATRSRKIYIN